MNQIVFDMTATTCALESDRRREKDREGERERERHGKNHRGFMMSEPSRERAFSLTGEEIRLQSVSLLTPTCNRHKHAPLLNQPLPFTLPARLLVCPVFKSAGNDAAH